MENVKKLERELYLVKDIALTAKAEAMQAKQEVSSHERECVIRYDSIKETLKAIPDLQKGIFTLQIGAAFIAGLVLFTKYGEAISKLLLP